MSINRKTWADKLVFDALSDSKKLLHQLDSENDEPTVRERLSAGKYNHWQSGIVNEWLRIKSEEKQSASDAHARNREIEALSIAKESNQIASSANFIAQSQADAAWRAARYAMYAAAISAATALIASKDEIFKLIYTLSN